MNYQKLDAALGVALQNSQDLAARILVVFIQTDPELDNTALALLEKLGVRGVTREKQIFTATLSVRQIDELSEQSWVKYLRLSQKLRFSEEK